MARRQDIDQILRDWPYEPGEVSARLVRAGDGCEVLQMRVEMGILQLKSTPAPMAKRPAAATRTSITCSSLASCTRAICPPLPLREFASADREFLQNCHRRICWLALREFGRATRDADHSLAFHGLRPG